jgi:ActR/RegA family two-component response regulator
MAEPGSDALRGCRLLIVEDDYLIAVDLSRSLESRGAEIVGPAGSVEGALRLIEAEGNRLDGAVLDINLRDERVYPVADALAARGVPFVFLTGYDAQVIPDTYAGVPRSEKPVSTALLARTLLKAGMR